MVKALFLDRDGVINEDLGYVSNISNFIFKDAIFDVLNFFSKSGFLLIIVTNQSGIGRGFYSQDDFLKLNNIMLETFHKRNININKVYFCPHIPEDNCKCRKPNIGMILQAKNDFKINLENSIMIGDKISDIRTAINSNIGIKVLLNNDNQKFENIEKFDYFDKFKLDGYEIFIINNLKNLIKVFENKEKI
ncbi:D-glycero-alpha-D-manno-heptose-1,7-bisphosphate 7-phosphatase [Campylobacter sputorum]|uniref:D-glycero-alpha-D-manno-heptose-1,7-bisphosphate 7-phosphatase n=1 Tax=Campylobacter sputorum TaxID=206 RepID=UPI0009DD5F35|nr:HAD family hydrolase [Campylobacter sputorum]